MNSYNALLNLRPKNFLIIIIILIGLLITFYYIGNLEFYDTYYTKGIYEDGLLYIDIPTNYLDTLKNGNILKINRKMVNYKIENLSLLENDGNTDINYQQVSLKIDSKYLNNQIVDVLIYAEKEKLIKKIKQLL